MTALFVKSCTEESIGVGMAVPEGGAGDAFYIRYSIIGDPTWTKDN